MTKQISITILLSLLIAIAFLFSLSTAQADPGGNYDLTWRTVDGGGVTFAKSNGYSLGGTVGQPDASVWRGDGYALAGGFWGGATAEYRVYLPLVLRNY